MLKNSELSFPSQIFWLFLVVTLLNTICPTTGTAGGKPNFVFTNDLATTKVLGVLPQKKLPLPEAEKKMEKPKETHQMEMEKKPNGTEEEEEEEVELPEETTGGPDHTIRKFRAMPDMAKVIENTKLPNFKGLRVVMAVAHINGVKQLHLVEAKWDNTDLELEGVTTKPNALDYYVTSPTWAYIDQSWEPSLCDAIKFFGSNILNTKDIQQNVVEADQRFYVAGVVTAYRKEGEQWNTLVRIDIQIVPMPEEFIP